MSTSIIIDDVTKRAEAGDQLAQQLAANWEYPVEMLFLTPDCRLVSKMNSFKDFPGVHPDVAGPSHGEHLLLRHPVRAHIDAFLIHMAHHFPGE